MIERYFKLPLDKKKEGKIMNRRVLEGLVWLLGGSVATLVLTLVVYFMVV